MTLPGTDQNQSISVLVYWAKLPSFAREILFIWNLIQSTRKNPVPTGTPSAYQFSYLSSVEVK